MLIENEDYMNYLILVNQANLFDEDMLGEIVFAGKDFNMKDVYLEKNTCEAVLKMLMLYLDLIK